MAPVSALPPEAEALVQEARRKLQHRGKCDVSEPHNDCAMGVLRDLARRLLEPGEKAAQSRGVAARPCHWMILGNPKYCVTHGAFKLAPGDLRCGAKR